SAMVSIDEFSAWVTVGGQKAQEYGVEVSEADKTVTCWIPSEEGKTFEVCWDDSSKRSATNGKLFVDGHPCGGEIIPAGGQSHVTRKGARVTFDSIRPFVFSRLSTTDDDDAATGSSSPEIGEIRVVMTRTHVSPSQSNLPAIINIPQSQIFHEKSKKAVDHQTSFGAAIPSKKPRIFHVKDYGDPVAQFRFRYRPLDMLQANGIAPLTQTRKRPSAKEEPDLDIIELSDDSDEELARLQARVKAIQDRQAANPRKKLKTGPKVKSEVKTEPLKGEFIDLTES
ncbi:hypothetical protein MPER_10249, partial [Moniliophthora perniciosa FA553]